jgi:hypothetical protein
MCHHTYTASNAKAASIGGCEDQISTGQGGTVDQQKIYEYAKSKNFLIMGGGGNGYKCFDKVKITRDGHSVEAIVMDNGNPKDVSTAVYSKLTGKTGIGKNCEGAAARLDTTQKVVGNIANEYKSFIGMENANKNGGNQQVQQQNPTANGPRNMGRTPKNPPGNPLIQSQPPAGQSRPISNPMAPRRLS